MCVWFQGTKRDGDGDKRRREKKRPALARHALRALTQMRQDAGTLSLSLSLSLARAAAAKRVVRRMRNFMLVLFLGLVGVRYLGGFV